MKCKHCGAEMEETAKTCPACGEAVRKNRITAAQLAVIIIVCATLIAVMVALVVSGMKKQPAEPAPGDEPSAPTADTTPTEGTPEETEPVEEPTVPPDGNPNDETCKGTYTVTDDEVRAAMNDVVATLGDAKLSNSLLQVYYWNQLYDLMEYYGDYVVYIGLDPSMPLDVQTFAGDSTRTWQQYFLASGITNWMRYQALFLEAENSEDFVPDPEYMTYLENLETNLNKTAQENGYADASAMLQADMGAGCTVQDYKQYLKLYYTGYQYFNDELDKIPLTDEDIEAYYTAHEDEMMEYGYSKEAGHTVDVRHILLIPADSEDESWETCRVEAEALLESWKNGEATEESFTALAKEHSKDPGSVEAGGLYEGVEQGAMVAEFNDWCFDESRQPGDYGLVKTTYGYHLMYFVGAGEEIWYTQSKTGLENERGTKLIEDALAKYSSSIDYKAIKLGAVDTVE